MDIQNTLEVKNINLFRIEDDISSYFMSKASEVSTPNCNIIPRTSQTDMSLLLANSIRLSDLRELAGSNNENMNAEKYVITAPIINNIENSGVNLNDFHKLSSPLNGTNRVGIVSDELCSNYEGTVKASYSIQTNGFICSGKNIGLHDRSYFSQWLDEKKDIELDECIDICLMPNRVGTRSSEASESCFACTPENDRVYIFNSSKSIGYTPNKKPYTEKIHLLSFPADKHDKSIFRMDIFIDCLQKVNKFSGVKADRNQDRLTGLFAGPIGGSQAHHHWHLIEKTTRLEKYINAHINNSTLLYSGIEHNNGVYHIKSSPLIDSNGSQILNKKLNSISYYDCLMVKGNEKYVSHMVERLINHFSENVTNKSGISLPRSLYHIVIISPDSQGLSRVVVFPRSAEPENAFIIKPNLWGPVKKYHPSAHEFAGHWNMIKMPENTNNYPSNVYEETVKNSFYEIVDSIRVPINDLSLDNLFNSTPKLFENEGLIYLKGNSSPKFESVIWPGWPRSQSLHSGNSQYLETIKEPVLTQGVDVDYINPILSNEQINNLYYLIKEANNIFTALNIPYFAGAGTLMGAIRHGGQMWNDDDADFFIRKNDADNFKNKSHDLFLLKDIKLESFKCGFRIFKKNSPRREDGFGIPFVDIILMDKVIYKNKSYYQFIDSPSLRCKTSGPTFIHKIPEDVLDKNDTVSFKFGRTKDFEGVNINVPKEHDSINYLNTVYGSNWFDVLKTPIRNHLNGGDSMSISLSIKNHGHLAPSYI